jgi:hypothetical protein
MLKYMLQDCQGQENGQESINPVIKVIPRQGLKRHKDFVDGGRNLDQHMPHDWPNEVQKPHIHRSCLNVDGVKLSIHVGGHLLEDVGPRQPIMVNRGNARHVQ